MELLKQFQCHICHGTLQGAVVCPHCGAKGCVSCFTTWLSNKQVCPYCRGGLTVKELVKLPWLDPIVIEAARHSFERDGENNSDEEPDLAALVREKAAAENCEKHNEVVKMYCKQCQCCICVRCFFETHQGHNCCLIDDVYRLEMQNLEQHLRKMKDQQTSLTQRMKEVECQVTQIDAASKKSVDQLNKFRDLFKEIIEKQREEKLKQLLDYHEQLTVHREALEHLLHRIEVVARPQSKPLILRARNEITQMIHDFLSKSLAPPPTINTELIPAMPECVVMDVVIPDFMEKLNKHKIIISDALNICGAQWILKLETSQPSATVAGPFLSAFIEMVKGPEDSVIPEAACEFVWKMEIVPVQDVPRYKVVREAQSRFCLHDSWGYDNLCSLELVQEHFVELETGKLHFRYSIQPSSYYLLYRLSEWHYHGLACATGSEMMSSPDVSDRLVQKRDRGNNHVNVDKHSPPTLVQQLEHRQQARQRQKASRSNGQDALHHESLAQLNTDNNDACPPNHQLSDKTSPTLRSRVSAAPQAVNNDHNVSSDHMECTNSFRSAGRPYNVANTRYSHQLMMGDRNISPAPHEQAEHHIAHANHIASQCVWMTSPEQENSSDDRKRLGRPSMTQTETRAGTSTNFTINDNHSGNTQETQWNTVSVADSGVPFSRWTQQVMGEKSNDQNDMAQASSSPPFYTNQRQLRYNQDSSSLRGVCRNDPPVPPQMSVEAAPTRQHTSPSPRHSIELFHAPRSMSSSPDPGDLSKTKSVGTLEPECITADHHIVPLSNNNDTSTPNQRGLDNSLHLSDLSMHERECGNDDMCAYSLSSTEEREPKSRFRSQKNGCDHCSHGRPRAKDEYGGGDDINVYGKEKGCSNFSPAFQKCNDDNDDVGHNNNSNDNNDNHFHHYHDGNVNDPNGLESTTQDVYQTHQHTLIHQPLSPEQTLHTSAARAALAMQHLVPGDENPSEKGRPHIFSPHPLLTSATGTFRPMARIQSPPPSHSQKKNRRDGTPTLHSSIDRAAIGSLLYIEPRYQDRLSGQPLKRQGKPDSILQRKENVLHTGLDTVDRRRQSKEQMASPKVHLSRDAQQPVVTRGTTSSDISMHSNTLAVQPQSLSVGPTQGLENQRGQEINEPIGADFRSAKPQTQREQKANSISHQTQPVVNGSSELEERIQHVPDTATVRSCHDNTCVTNLQNLSNRPNTFSNVKRDQYDLREVSLQEEKHIQPQERCGDAIYVSCVNWESVEHRHNISFRFNAGTSQAIPPSTTKSAQLPDNIATPSEHSNSPDPNHIQHILKAVNAENETQSNMKEGNANEQCDTKLSSNDKHDYYDEGRFSTSLPGCNSRAMHWMFMHVHPSSGVGWEEHCEHQISEHMYDRDEPIQYEIHSQNCQNGHERSISGPHSRVQSDDSSHWDNRQLTMSLQDLPTPYSAEDCTLGNHRSRWSSNSSRSTEVIGKTNSLKTEPLLPSPIKSFHKHENTPSSPSFQPPNNGSDGSRKTNSISTTSTSVIPTMKIKKSNPSNQAVPLSSDEEDIAAPATNSRTSARAGDALKELRYRSREHANGTNKEPAK